MPVRRSIPAALALAATLSAPAVAQEAERPVLTVYTYESFTPDYGPGPKVEAAFEKDCGCDLQFVGLEDGVAILNRLKLEGASTKADIALGMTSDLLPEMKATGLFAESGVDLSPLAIPGGYADPVFVPFDYSYLAFVYDTQVVKDPPKSLEDLVSGDPDQKIVIEDPRTSTPGLGFLLWMKAVYGDGAAAKWAALKPRILTVTPGWSEAYGLFTNGEVPIVLSYTTSPAYHMIEEKTERYQAAAFAEGQYLQVEVAGRLKSAKNPDLARRFLAFLLTPAFQEIIPTANWSLPATDIAASLPPEFDRLVKVEKPLSIDPETVAANRRAWTQEYLEALGR
ncbi:thiamine ABC transporter substrate binding subunit [Aurantimonas sp. Leaf443]|uniref:thiamine ABC transporter substrate binding subunit n=1 Tax=Aurantimonas sp. Leaf443 TaxID=1736378 RepID=UPI0006FE0D7A|nr:thiamine ABC transporter substrate binding subunit [Aurantimonas sp. Leaf443]KQT85158.1 thiamine ABC transporter substrate-binding protein [Aurantimonas sp. Leaf443]